jgi:pimeloyl-ACP methyl ester carboxylesterase
VTEAGAEAESPEWYWRALAAPVQENFTICDSIEIAYRQWGDPGNQGIVLVHGGGAHSRWWDHIAPLLAHGRTVVALDLSGHGDSGRRPEYSLDEWAREVFAVAQAARFTQPPVVIGHSLGGFVTLRAASMFGSQLGGIMVVDSPVRDVTPEERAAREQRAFGPLKVYTTYDAAIEHFRPIPEQDTLPYITAHIAETSLRKVEGGWSWKFDRHIFARPEMGLSLLGHLDCRVALFRGEHGMLSSDMSDAIYDRLGGVAPVIEIPAAAHHIMLDQPIALITGIRSLLADWDHSLSLLPPADAHDQV